MVQTKLAAGDTVQIMGELDTYYKIVPPKGVVLYVSSQYVKRGTEADRLLAERPEPTTRTVIEPPPATQRVQEFGVDELEGKAFKAAMDRFKAEAAKPAEERNLAELMRMFQDLPQAQERVRAAPEGDGQRHPGHDRPGPEQAGPRQTHGRGPQAWEESERQIAELKAKPPYDPPPPMYAAEGLLTVSELFPGGPTGPQRVRRARAQQPADHRLCAEHRRRREPAAVREFARGRVRQGQVRRKRAAVCDRGRPGRSDQVRQPPTPKPQPKADPTKPPAPKPAAAAAPPASPAPAAAAPQPWPAPKAGTGGHPPAPAPTATTAPASAGLPVAEPTTAPAAPGGFE